MLATLPANSGLTLYSVWLLNMSSLAKCRVCGKEYKPCRSVVADGVFRWQAVSCSPECGAKYLRLIEESRVPKTEDTQTRSKKKSSEPVLVDSSEDKKSVETTD